VKTIPEFDLSKTLFVSDLDGTLLTDGAVFPADRDIPNRIRRLTDRGIRLTYATARTLYSTKFILKDVPFPAPIALMNGVLIRDMNKGEYLSAAYLPLKKTEAVLSLMESHGLSPFVYSLCDGVLSACHTEKINLYMRDFIEERSKKYDKPFTCVNRIADAASDGTIYVVAMDTPDVLRPVYEAVSADPELKCAFYRDTYRPEFWYLEVFSADASKGAAIRRLRSLTGAETVVAFGDNGNDLPMFAESDFACAVENAADPVRAAADAVIGSAQTGGVIDFLEQLIR